jgi:hypothetical protein
MAVGAGFAAIGATRGLVMIVATVMGVATTLGRQGFDSLVQRRAPHALHGRWFARFETQFQLGWVLGAAFATAAAIPTRISLAVVAGVLVPSAALYLRAVREAVHFAAPAPAASSTVGARIEAAEHWLASGRPQFATIEAATAIDLASSMGIAVPTGTASAIEVLRRRAIVPGCPQAADDAAAAIALARQLSEGDDVSRSGSRRPPST